MSFDDDDDGGGSPKLPHDVVIEILKRLPVRCLLRFRCVCRSWHSTIDDPHFMAVHSNHSALHASDPYLVALDVANDRVPTVCSMFSNESLTPPSPWQIEIPFFTPPNDHLFVGSCNGLICVKETSLRDGPEQTVYLWNIFTRKHKAVPLPHPGMTHVVRGFCFDAKSNDYHVVRFLHFACVHYRCYEINKPQVEIYSLRTDSWRTLECEVPLLYHRSRAVSLNGNLHWYALDWKAGVAGSIASLDIAGEVFDIMALSEEMLPKDSSLVVAEVAVLNDLLAVFVCRGGPPGNHESHSPCSVWVMRDYGVPESWTKLYTFEVSGGVSAFDGFTWKGEFLIENDDVERVSWNPITGQLSNLPVPRGCDLVSVVESFFSPWIRLG
ncbi:hypothetical protein BT93_K1843 [Corymbia citriodora subsp. variegata]|nr:hypothetical protein BT93_K1843 [Corymbia citriodora subsp. variegata]